MKVLDPAGHTKLVVSDFKKSFLFYSALFRILGYRQIREDENRAGWRSQQGYGIWIAQAKFPKYKYKHSAPGLHHLCLKSLDTKNVDKLYKFLLKKKVKIFDAPQKYPNYTDKYYAVFFADPDGVKLEVAYY